MRQGDAPIARAAIANSLTASRATIARTPRATIGHPSSVSTTVISVKIVDGRDRVGQRRARRQHDVEHRQHEHQLRRAHRERVERAAGVAGHDADERGRARARRRTP